ncbi:MAG: adenosylhomocysteinase [Candidatus Omnitrophica bacterium]|nr:adenosylhomocysteinase [Candidatus Omnitrophota bacterium]MCM8797946.1 adenosylhomocysteinase [Candidatus Omnitrophota bacterium]
MAYEVKDINLAKKGILRIEWAKNNMQVMNLIGERFTKEKPLKGIKISACLHVTTETAVLMEVLKKGGAEIALCASNPLSTQDDVAASLVKHLGISVFAIKGEDRKTYYRHIKSCLSIKPQITMDDGADLVSTIHQNIGIAKHQNFGLPWGGTEETTTGVIRLRALEREGKLKYPIIAVNDAQTKHLFDNRYGTGQSTLDGIIRATNRLIAGTNFVICGYGWCGKGVAMRAKGMGAKVIICETNPLRALEASLDGYVVMPLKEAVKIGDIFVTVTGNINVLRKEHFILMKDGAILANAGHFNVEIDIPSLEKMSREKRRMRDFVEEFILKNGKKIYLLGEGRLINLVSAEGHPAQVMDMSFANQALSVEYIVRNYRKLEKKVYPVPSEIDTRVASFKLKSLGIAIDRLTLEQKKYLSSWEAGT